MIFDQIMNGRVVVVRNQWARWAAYLFDGVPLRFIIVRDYIYPNGYTIATERELSMMDAAQGWRAKA